MLIFLVDQPVIFSMCIGTIEECGCGSWSRIGHKDSIVSMQHSCFSTDVVAVSGERED